MAMPIKPLTTSQVKKAKSKDKTYKLADDGGLNWYVNKTDIKSWRAYPEITLAQARKFMTELKEGLAVGTDPFEKRKSEEQEQLRQHLCRY